MGVFHGSWICAPEFANVVPRNMYHKQQDAADFVIDEGREPQNIHTMFVRNFLLDQLSGRYLLRISSDDYGKYYINGKFVGQGPAPDYLETYRYNEFDVTEFLHQGENVICAHVYYQGVINRVWISGDLRMGLIADLVGPEGDIVISTDASWRCADIKNFGAGHKIGYQTQFAEYYDSRIPLGEFRPVALRGSMGVSFWDEPAQPIQISTAIPPVCEPLVDGGWFYDFGHEITGGLVIKAKGRAGETVRILCGEETEDSAVRVRYETRCNCRYEEFWTLADGLTDLEQYDYKAFRYVALIPSSPAVEIISVSATVRHGAFDDALCTLECEDSVLKSVFNLCKKGVKYGTQEIFTDCPSREKGQYSGDMTVTSGSQLWLTGDIYMLEKGIRAHAASARICNGFMAVLSGSLMQEIADYSLQFPLLLLRHYAFTRNGDFLREMLPYAEKMLEHFQRYARGDGLLESVTDKWNLVDWPENLRDNYDFTLTNPVGPGAHNVINAFYVGATKNVEQIKKILGIPHEHKSDVLAAAFNHAFFRPDLGVYVDCEGSEHASLHANLLAPFYGLIPAGYEKSVGNFLVSKGVCCGVYMSYFLLRGLCRLGYYDYVYDRITATDEHSWFNMIRDGATTCMEAWGKDQKWNTSFCHPWASAPICILIEDLLGVQYDGTVGCCHLPPKAGHLRMKIPTAKGVVEVSV